MSEDAEKTQEQIDISKIEIRSEEVQEIMGYIPIWIIRWGISLFFGIIFLFFVGSWFFKYPDIISSAILVTTTNPPAVIVAKSSGKIQHLFVQNNQEVKKEEYIAIIENSVNHRHLTELKNQLESIKSFFIRFESGGFVSFNTEYALGELQSPYAQFLNSYEDYRRFIELDYHNKKIASLKEQLEKQNTLVERETESVKIAAEELQLSKQRYKRSEELYNEGIISQNDFGTAKSDHLRTEKDFSNARSEITRARIEISQLRQQILEQELEREKQADQLQLVLSKYYEDLSGYLALWEQKFVLKTPVKGVVSFTKFWSATQNVKVGDNVFTVVPSEASEIIGKVVLPVRGSAKVKIGQKVNIKFADYPFVEYGMVRGIIKAKSLVSTNNHYHLEVDLPYGLKTNYGKELEFIQEMQGAAEIITEDVRLLERFFKPIKALLKKHIDE
ncbi:MAG: HlyD family efflux transporter periplasmic adaptor subunit [Candidatus Aminicenantes bacterium]|nr:HlyD family efflux transporter periplasmic adaptor subunit [Candidatus Aminicenantes bacterium]